MHAIEIQLCLITLRKLEANLKYTTNLLKADLLFLNAITHSFVILRLISIDMKSKHL